MPNRIFRIPNNIKPKFIPFNFTQVNPLRITFLVFIWVTTFNVFAENKKIANVNEYQIKAAFLYNFANFTQWPSDSLSDASPIIKIGVIGDDPFGITLDITAENATVRGKKLVVERFPGINDLKFCHILFISKSEKNSLDEIFKKLEGSPVLTVSELDGFAQRGGIINFIQKKGRSLFEINPGAAKQANLKIGSKLLQLAKIVKSKKRKK